MDFFGIEKVFGFVFFFIFGSAVGSFLNSLFYRLETKKDFLRGRSFCPHCLHFLSPIDLIPILSFIILKGKCRYCKKRISFQYPIVESITGLSFLFLFPFISKPIQFLLLLITIPLLVLLLIYDIRYLMVPDTILNALIFISILYALSNHYPATNILLAILPIIFFGAIIFFSHETLMGWGDFKILLASAFFLSFPKIILSIFISIFLGTIWGVLLLLLRRKTLKSQIPFAPFLVFGTMAMIFLPMPPLEKLLIFLFS